jgi:hypothetical protein
VSVACHLKRTATTHRIHSRDLVRYGKLRFESADVRSRTKNAREIETALIVVERVVVAARVDGRASLGECVRPAALEIK